MRAKAGYTRRYNPEDNQNHQIKVHLNKS